MRGYENVFLSLTNEPVIRYESPCGVMRLLRRWNNAPNDKLRIPMRGYEISDNESLMKASPVTNPHAGL